MSEVTAPPAVQARLLELQELDTALDQARAAVRRLKADPEHARLRARAQELEAALPGLQDAARTADRAGAEATEKAAATRARRDRTRERLEAGQGGSKELQAMQHEDDTLTALLDDHEAAALEAMEAADAAESRLAKGHAALEQARAEVEARAAEVRREGQAVTQRGRDLTQRRAALAAEFPASLLALYEQARERNGGIGAARLVGNRSAAAGTELSPAEVARIRALPPAAVARCPESGAILIRA